MATFSKRQQQIPQPSRGVSVVGVAYADDAGVGADAIRAALTRLADATGTPASRMQGFIQGGFYAFGAGEDSSGVHAALDLAPLPGVVVADSALALWQAALAVSSGQLDAVLVGGWDDGGAVCAVVADRETAETLSPGARPLVTATSMAAPHAAGDAVEHAADTVRALVGSPLDAPSCDAGTLDALRWLAAALEGGTDHTATVFVTGAQVTALVV